MIPPESSGSRDVPLDAKLGELDQLVDVAQVSKVEALLGSGWRDRTFVDLARAIVRTATPTENPQVAYFAEAIVNELARGIDFRQIMRNVRAGWPGELTDQQREAVRYVLGRFGIALD